MFMFAIRLSSIVLITLSLQSIAMHNGTHNNVHIAIAIQESTSSQSDTLCSNKFLKRAVGVIWGASLFVLSQVPESVCRVSQCSQTSDTLAQIISVAGPAIGLLGAYTMATSSTKRQRITNDAA